MKAEVTAGSLSLWGVFTHFSDKVPNNIEWLASGWVGIWTLVLSDSRLGAKYFVSEQTWGKPSSEWLGLESPSLKSNPVPRKTHGPLGWNKHMRSLFAYLCMSTSRFLSPTPHFFPEQATSLAFFWGVYTCSKSSGIFWTSATSPTCWCRGCEPLHA